MIDGRALAEAEGGGLPFPVGEYKERVERVRREMARREIDLLFVSSPSNITYLTGYDMIWYYLTSPVGVAVHAEAGQTLFFEVPYHKVTVEWHATAGQALPRVMCWHSWMRMSLCRPRLSKRSMRRRAIPPASVEVWGWSTDPNDWSSDCICDVGSSSRDSQGWSRGPRSSAAGAH